MSNIFVVKLYLALAKWKPHVHISFRQMCMFISIKWLKSPLDFKMLLTVCGIPIPISAISKSKVIFTLSAFIFCEIHLNFWNRIFLEYLIEPLSTQILEFYPGILHKIVTRLRTCLSFNRFDCSFDLKRCSLECWC